MATAATTAPTISLTICAAGIIAVSAWWIISTWANGRDAAMGATKDNRWLLMGLKVNHGVPR